MVNETDHTHYHYCNLDRMVTWCLHYPEELPNIKKKIATTD
ncbi:hypothetical protein OEV98_14275 [Caldibacillus lycopersici]|uniref:Uncharacterized protein n=1 Tax=Perspicuibacillus lycopersici TaxID=1325689 RepID=A0AAE3IWJ6_9BACI|nr:hypothetical protein [Perspicuibacillus lycopersici]MCU9614706.1 hypothetical protein [Perspicuibacillus lycopersici]